MSEAWLWSQASRKPCCESTNDNPCLHMTSENPLEPSLCQVAPASVVCQMEMVSELHPCEPPVFSQPSLSLTKEISGLGRRVGTRGRCTQGAPLSLERSRYRSATSAQTTSVEGARSWA